MTRIILEITPDDHSEDVELTEGEAQLLRSKNAGFWCSVCSNAERRVMHPMPWMDKDDVMKELGKGEQS